MTDVVQKLRGLYNTPRHDGINYGDYIEQLTYLLFLKLADEKEGHAPSDALARELIDHCKEKIAEYKRPRWVEFVPELPKTATGKIQRFKMRDG